MMTLREVSERVLRDLDAKGGLMPALLFVAETARCGRGALRSRGAPRCTRPNRCR